MVYFDLAFQCLLTVNYMPVLESLHNNFFISYLAALKPMTRRQPHSPESQLNYYADSNSTQSSPRVS